MKDTSILIVEDNPDNLALTRMLLQFEGYPVRTAEDAEQALHILEADCPDLILLDIQLPGMDGLELARRVRQNSALRNVVIVALTAYAMQGDEENALAAGCDGYITKPIDTRAFPGMIRRYLESNTTKLG